MQVENVASVSKAGVGLLKWVLEQLDRAPTTMTTQIASRTIEVTPKKPSIIETVTPLLDIEEEKVQLQQKIDDVQILDLPPSPVRANPAPRSFGEQRGRIDQLE